MYICGLILRNFAELAEAVPIGMNVEFINEWYIIYIHNITKGQPRSNPETKKLMKGLSMVMLFLLQFTF